MSFPWETADCFRCWASLAKRKHLMTGKYLLAIRCIIFGNAVNFPQVSDFSSSRRTLFQGRFCKSYKSRLPRGGEQQLGVLQESFALLEVALRPNDSRKFAGGNWPRGCFTASQAKDSVAARSSDHVRSARIGWSLDFLLGVLRVVWSTRLVKGLHLARD